MLKGKMIVGLCSTRINEKIHSDIVVKLKEAFGRENIKLVVYNSNRDFYVKDINSKSAACIYRHIDFEMVDVLLVMSRCFRDVNVFNSILARAKKHNTPVIIIDGDAEEHSSIVAECTEAYMELIDHVINVHHARNTVFIGGHNTSVDTDTVFRLNCYKAVLMANGIEFSESNVYYGNYWEGPTVKIVKELYAANKLPQAFICANDTMAIAVSTALQELGKRVPEDVLVTGFDGMPVTSLVKPKISTCKPDLDELANKCVNMVKALSEKPTEVYKDSYSYMPILSESCGCPSQAQPDVFLDYARLIKNSDTMAAHEYFVFSAVNNMLRMTALESLYGPLSKMLVNSSYMCINGELADLSHQKVEDKLVDVSNNLIIVPSYYSEAEDNTIRHMSMESHLPEEDNWINDNTAFVITPVYAGEFVCGYYAAKVDSFVDEYNQVMRVSKFLNLAFNSVISQMIQKRMINNIENSMYMDSTTSLPNLKGASKWFETFKSEPIMRSKPMSFSVYTIPKYSYIYENYGIHEIEDIVSFVSDLLKEVNKEKCYLARTSDDEFVVINYYDDESEIGETIDKATQEFFGRIDDFNNSSAKEYYIEINCGCSVASAGWDGNFESFVRHAYSEMYLNRLMYGSKEVFKENTTPREMYSAFCLLMENKLFSYHFQPIIDARTGEIYAYEAVMRTGGGIKLSPQSILDIARVYGRLDELERITFNCILERFDKDYKEFKDRLVFVNTIPGHFLSVEERDKIVKKYSHLMGSLVFEVTEQDSITDDELESIRKLQSQSGESRIAIDDYGTGHSNIVNLLRYAPQVIKIDHYLISGVESDSNKQMFIKNTVEFAALNNIKVLAEGVETREELIKVIELGVDLIQGYYTGRPAPQPLEDLSPELKSEIVGENITLSKYDNEQLVYDAKYGEIISIVDLALAKYTTIIVRGGDITFIGDRDNTANMVIKVLDNAKSTLTFIDVNIKGVEETTVQLGLNTTTKLNLIGVNTLNKEGILVPKSSSLKIVGDGDLIINNNRNYSVGIGTNFNDTFGDISINITGALTVRSSGDKVVGIGGGRGDNSQINLINGDIDISGKGIKAINIGSAEGKTKIDIGRIKIKAYSTGDDSVCIGSLDGSAEINSQGDIEAVCDGERSAVIGSINGENNVLNLEGGNLDLVVHCDTGCAIGTVKGSMQFTNENAYIKIYGEGSSVCAIGSNGGKLRATINGGEVLADLSAAEYHLLGNKKDSVIINGGNIVLQKTPSIIAKNMFGESLEWVKVEGDVFCQVVSCDLGKYEYRARRKNADRTCVYLPVSKA